MKVFKVLVFCAWLTLAKSYKILGVFPLPSKSHFAIGNSVMKSLVDEGHDVTIISPFPNKKPQPNIRDISMVDVLDGFFKNSGPDPFVMGKMPVAMMMFFMMKMGVNLSNMTLGHPEVQELMNSNEKFDAVIVEVFNIEALMGLAQHFDCPLIGVTTFGAVKWIDKMTGNQSPYSYVPQPFLHYTDKMTFPQRLYNTVFSIFEHALFELVHLPMQSKLYYEYFPKSKLSFSELMKSPSILLLNNHVSSSSPRPYLPNLIEIGGIHVEAAKELPLDIMNFLDSADEGVIYFSMGSFIQSKDWPIEKREALVKVFAKLKQKVIWKYENETLPGNPGNIMIGSWLPQRDILAHPNVKVFITHGGLLGTTEALVEGVPVLGFPIFGDQKMNMAKAVVRGYGLQVDYDDISEEVVTEKLNELLNNPSYDDNAKEISRRFSDRPITPKKAVSFWVEYAIRHNGADHLKAAGNSLNFIQFHLIDVYATLSLLALIIMYINFIIFRKIARKLFSNNKKTVKKSKKKN